MGPRTKPRPSNGFGIKDVPCVSCQKGYRQRHACEIPMYCACDQTQNHEATDA